MANILRSIPGVNLQTSDSFGIDSEDFSIPKTWIYCYMRVVPKLRPILNMFCEKLN